MDRLVQTAQQAVHGVGPQSLRDDQSLRQRIAGRLSAVSASLDGLLVNRPRRKILRSAVAASSASAVAATGQGEANVPTPRGAIGRGSRRRPAQGDGGVSLLVIRPRTAGPSLCTPRRSTSPALARSPFAGPVRSSRTTLAYGGRTCRLSAGRPWVRSPGAAKPSPPRGTG